MKVSIALADFSVEDMVVKDCSVEDMVGMVCKRQTLRTGASEASSERAHVQQCEWRGVNEVSCMAWCESSSVHGVVRIEYEGSVPNGNSIPHHGVERREQGERAHST